MTAITMQSPMVWPFSDKVVPGKLMPSGTTYLPNAFGSIEADVLDIGELLGYGFEVTSVGQVGALFGQTQPVTVSNRVAETTLLGSGIGSLVLTPNYLVPGRTLRLWGMGYHSASGNPSIRLRIYLNSVALLDTGIVTSGNSSNALFELRAQIMCQSNGPNGQFWSQGRYAEEGGGSNFFGLVNTTPDTVDTTVTQTMNVTVQWGVASTGNSLTMTNFLLEETIPAN